MLSMKDYIKNLEDIKDIRKAGRGEALTKCELKEDRKMIGNITWLENSTWRCFPFPGE